MTDHPESRTLQDDAGEGGLPSEAVPPEPLPPANGAGFLEEIRERAETVRCPAAERRRDRAPRRWGVDPVSLRGPGGRVAVVAGCRTPFCRSGAELRHLDVLDLAGLATAELVSRAGLTGEELDRIILGVVIPPLPAPNLGREVVFRAALPPTLDGNTVNVACASSCRALVDGALALLTGEAGFILAGGAESLSNLPVRYSSASAAKLRRFSKAGNVRARLAALGKLRLKDFAPVKPAIVDHSTGLTIGESTERMVRENDISRRAMDEVTLRSHQRAAAARADGRLAPQIFPVAPRSGVPELVLQDGALRQDLSSDGLAELPPIFDPVHGALTIANSSPLADGAAVLLLATEERAQSLGEPLGYLRSYAWCALSPADQQLQGPAYAVPLALDRAGLELADMDLVELHEAYGAQVISNLKALASERFAREELGREGPVGEVDLERLNVNGGSLAFGHPFGATGARLVLQLLTELRRRNARYGLLALCAAGGVGVAMVFERDGAAGESP